MSQVMFDVDSVIKKINEGKKLLLAGDEKILQQLPQGNWIGGTIPYFMSESGGINSPDKIFVNELPHYVKHIKLQTYNENTIQNINNDAPDNGFSVIIMPAVSKIHQSFALNSPNFPGFATKPVIGWISGVHVNDIGKVKPKVFFGNNGKIMEEGAVVMHCELPADKYAEINIINIFHQGNGDIISFPEDGFSAKDVTINGKKVNFADYVLEKNIDTKLPLVADYCGAMINISFQNVDETAKRVNFYAPVFKGIQYRQAAPVGDYISSFTTHLPEEGIDNIAFSCNCILNYLYSELEGKKTGSITGPITFGEIAYQLVNQTLAYMTINDI